MNTASLAWLGLALAAAALGWLARAFSQRTLRTAALAVLAASACAVTWLSLIHI